MKPNTRKLSELAPYFSCLLFVIAPLWAKGATTNVNVVDYAYDPPAVTINVNDQVQWTWDGNYHSTTSSDSLWDSGVYNPPHTYAFQFTSTGTYSYYCSIHYFYGSVTVQVPSVPPTVSITNPANNAVFSAPASFFLAATAAATGVSITNVQFLNGANSLGNVTSSPYTLAVNNLAAGHYTFYAVATDSNGGQATNSIAVRVVAPAPITLSSAQFVPPSSFQFSYSANVGLNYLVQRSADLINWTPILTNEATINPMSFLDPNATANANFYRIELLPNP